MNLKKAALLAPMLALVCAAQQNGSISGTVTTAAGERLANAMISLQRLDVPRGARGGALQYSDDSDAKGNFTFEDLEPGRYTLSSEKNGYLKATYGERVFMGIQIKEIDLAAGQTLAGIEIKMTRQAVISGRISDEDGDPYPNARINLARWGYENGRKRLQLFGGSITSNAEGDFAIGNLAKGSYFILAMHQIGPSIPAQSGPVEAYMTTYYPGVTDPSKAIAVQVAAGETVRGADIRLRKARAYRVRGTAIDLASGSAMPNTVLRLDPKDGPPINPISAGVRDGVFKFEGVLPGVYILQSVAQSVTSAVGARTMTSGMARQIVTVGSADVDDVVVEFRTGVDITGKISIEGAAPMSPRPTVLLASKERLLNSVPRPQTNDDGTFAAHNIPPGQYEVVVASLPPGTYVKSISFNGRDVANAALDLTSGGGGTLDVVLAANAADIGGIVHGADGMPLETVIVTLWTPGAPMDGADAFVRSGLTGPAGKFSFGNLPPGEYLIAAWEELEYGLDLVTDFRIKFDSQAAMVKLDENEHANIEAPLIGRDAIETEVAKLQ